MKTEACIKFKLPKEQFAFDIYMKAESMHEALVEMQRFLFNGNRDLSLEDIQGFFKDQVQGLPL